MRLGVLGGTFDPPHLGHLALARHALAELALDRVLLMPARHSPHKPPPPADDGRLHADRGRLNTDRGQLHAGAAERLEMCRLIASAEPDVEVSDLELRRAGPSYTVDTLGELDGADPRTSLVFILGADVARTLPTWREPQALLALAELAVAVRPGTATEEVRSALAPLLAKKSPPRACVRARARACGGEDGEEGYVREGDLPERDTREGDLPEGDTVEGDPGEGRVRFLSMPALDVSSSLVRERALRGESIEELVGPAVAAYIEEHGLYRARLAGVSAR